MWRPKRTRDYIIIFWYFTSTGAWAVVLLGSLQAMSLKYLTKRTALNAAAKNPALCNFNHLRGIPRAGRPKTFEKRQCLRKTQTRTLQNERKIGNNSVPWIALLSWISPASSFSPIPKESLADPEEIATMLEERYRVLLPPDRVWRVLEPASSESASRN